MRIVDEHFNMREIMIVASLVLVVFFGIKAYALFVVWGAKALGF